jgi:serine protease inhibitor
LSLLVVLPRKGTGVGSLLRHLGARGLSQVVRSLRDSLVELSLPRFHLATHARLNGALKSLGMPVAFGEAADFSRITGDESLKIALVEHAADLTVEEGGTVAAAATAVVLKLKSKPRGPVAFNANRPFLFFLRDVHTGAVLFAGRVTNPT